MMDNAQIEREFRRVLNSRKSALEMTTMFDRLAHKINDHYASLRDDAVKAKFRAEYRALVETKFPVPTGSATNKTKLSQLLHDHAGNLESIEKTKEKLNRELGDF
jgi:hypothetical protein